MCARGGIPPPGIASSAAGLLPKRPQNISGTLRSEAQRIPQRAAGARGPARGRENLLPFPFAGPNGAAQPFRVPSGGFPKPLEEMRLGELQERRQGLKVAH